MRVHGGHHFSDIAADADDDDDDDDEFIDERQQASFDAVSCCLSNYKHNTCKHP